LYTQALDSRVSYLEKMDHTFMVPPTATITRLLEGCPNTGTDMLFMDWRDRAHRVYRQIINSVTPAMASSEDFRKLVDSLCVRALEEVFTAELAQRGLVASAAAAKFKAVATSKQRTLDTRTELEHLTSYANHLGQDLISALSRPSPASFGIEDRLATALHAVKVDEPDVMSVQATLANLSTERTVKMVKSPASYLMYLGDTIAHVERALLRAGELKAEAEVAFRLYAARDALLVSSVVVVWVHNLGAGQLHV
jgi:hypothetical protein